MQVMNGVYKLKYYTLVWVAKKLCTSNLASDRISTVVLLE